LTGEPPDISSMKVEDAAVVAKVGDENLSARVPKRADDIEALMSQ
jgi:hypothetical protein